MAVYTHHTVVRFSQVDAAGVLYFSRALELCHEAFEAFLAARGTPLVPARFSGEELILPIVHADVDFKAPLRLGDEVDVHISVERVGTASITLAFELAGRDGGVRAVARHVHTAVDATSFTSRPLPDAVRAWGVS